MKLPDFVMLLILAFVVVALCTLSGCMTNNFNLVCGEHNQIKASDNDTPKTAVDTALKIPLR